MKQRIQKVLANAGVASRRAIEEMVRQGRVGVNGTTVTRLPVLIDDDDRVTVDEELIKRAKSSGAAGAAIYILLNKPKGVYCTNAPQGEQTRAIDLLPPGLPARVYCVGRLDAQSKGLLLMTNDGELTQRLTHPRYGVAKTYRAVVDGSVTAKTVEQMGEGVWLADVKKGTGFKTGRCQVKIVKRVRDKTVLELTLREGRNVEVRRILAKLGHKVRELTRVGFGPLTLDRLAPGQSRLLSHGEIRRLREWSHQRPEKRVTSPGPSDRPADSI